MTLIDFLINWNRILKMLSRAVLKMCFNYYKFNKYNFFVTQYSLYDYRVQDDQIFLIINNKDTYSEFISSMILTNKTVEVNFLTMDLL